jgi:Flp pilus assembly protein TadG
MHASHKRAGTVLMEFALVVPLFLLICLAGIDFARVFAAAMVINGANRVGLQYASQNPGSTSRISSFVTADAALAGLTVTSSQYCACSAGGTPVTCTSSCSGKMTYTQVTTTLPFKTVAAWPGVPDNLRLSISGTIRVQ